MNNSSQIDNQLPANVPPALVVDFDIYAPLEEGTDLHKSWINLRDSSPAPVVWTPHNGGHWIALRSNLIKTILADYEHFSTHTVLVPKDTAGEAYRLIPLSIDPPNHSHYRNLLNKSLSPKAIRALQETIRTLTIELIEGFRSQGQCNFTQDFAEKLPISVFMKIVDLPIEDLPKVKYYVDQFTRPDGDISVLESVQLFREYLSPIIQSRRGSGRQDMLSQIINGQVLGRALTDIEASKICMQVLTGGLDTVVNFMGFTLLYLAQHEEIRVQLAENPADIPAAVEEFLRRFPLVASAREISQDYQFEGVELKAGDMIMAPTMLCGLDEVDNPDPFTVHFDRRESHHATFGNGSHICPGSQLARTEMIIVLEEWLKRIPSFKLSPEQAISFTNGIVGSVNPFVLKWGLP